MIARQWTWLFWPSPLLLCGWGARRRFSRLGVTRAPAPGCRGRPPKAVLVEADDDTIRVRLLTIEAVTRDLGLTADQTRELDELTRKCQPSSTISATSARSIRQKMIESMKESDQVQAKATKHVLDVLTPEQRTKFEKLHGKKNDTTPDYDAWIPEDAEF